MHVLPVPDMHIRLVENASVNDCLSLCHKLVNWVRTAGIGSSCAIKRVCTGGVWMEGQAYTNK